MAGHRWHTYSGVIACVANLFAPELTLKAPVATTYDLLNNTHLAALAKYCISEHRPLLESACRRRKHYPLGHPNALHRRMVGEFWSMRGGTTGMERTRAGRPSNPGPSCDPSHLVPK